MAVLRIGYLMMMTMTMTMMMMTMTIMMGHQVKHSIVKPSFPTFSRHVTPRRLHVGYTSVTRRLHVGYVGYRRNLHQNVGYKSVTRPLHARYVGYDSIFWLREKVGNDGYTIGCLR